MIKERIVEISPKSIVLISDYDSAIIGLDSKNRVVYSIEKVLRILEKYMKSDDALDYFTYNIECAYMGELTPIYVYTEF